MHNNDQLVYYCEAIIKTNNKTCSDLLNGYASPSKNDVSTFAKWYESNVHAPYAEDAGTSWAGCPNGIFTVSRRAVHRRSRQEWERLLEHNYPMAKEERRHAHQDVKSESEVAHFFERAWGGLFAGAGVTASSRVSSPLV